MERKWKDWFEFPARERSAILILGLLVLFIYALPFFYKAPPMPTEEEWKEWVAPLAAPDQQEHPHNYVQTASRDSGFARVKVVPPFSPKRLFRFDPNSIGVEEWMELGLTEKTASVIVNYRIKGGRFRTADDLEMIYSIPKEALPVLRPYVQINPSNNLRGVPGKPEVLVYLNRSLAADWEQLPGIGPVLARRIEAFRTRLGGFHSVSQVAETFGLPDSTFQKIRNRIKEDHVPLKRIALNEVSEDSLGAHPYIKRTLAKRIIAWRNQHGRIASPEALDRILALPPEKIALLTPYLDFGEN